MSFNRFAKLMFLLFWMALMFIPVMLSPTSSRITTFSTGASFGLALFGFLLLLLDTLATAYLQHLLRQNAAKPDQRDSERRYPANIHPARLARLLGLVPDAFTALGNGQYKMLTYGMNEIDRRRIVIRLFDNAAMRPPGGTTPLYDIVAFDKSSEEGIGLALEFGLYWYQEPDLQRLILSKPPIIGHSVMLTPPSALEPPAENRLQ